MRAMEEEREMRDAGLEDDDFVNSST